MISIVLGSTLYSTTLLIASTLLPQMQGAMSATQDEIAWAMTFNILATAVVTPMTGWLVARFGRRHVMVGSMALFSLFTYLCGAADSLETLVLWRILQGAAGAPVTPLSQTILFDIFPRRQHRMITSIYGMTVVIGPVIGPALGGYMADMYSWRWAFYGLVPVGVASCIGLRLSMLPDPPRTRCGSTGSAFSACRRRSPACSWCCRAASGSTGTNRRKSGWRRSARSSPSTSSWRTA